MDAPQAQGDHISMDGELKRDFPSPAVRAGVGRPHWIKSRAPQLVVGCIGGDEIDPCPKRRVTPEQFDSSHHSPQRVLHDLFCVRLAAGDSHREPIRSSAVCADERLRCIGARLAQAFHQIPVREL